MDINNYELIQKRETESFFLGDESHLLQKYQIYSSKELLTVVDFGRIWTTVFFAKLCLFFRKLLSYSKVFQQRR